MRREPGLGLIETPAAGVFKHHCSAQALGVVRGSTFEANKDVNAQIPHRAMRPSLQTPGTSSRAAAVRTS
jgi:hypothetical protein